MPGKPRTSKRKQWKRKPRARRGYPTNVNRSLQPIPQRFICKLKYATTMVTGALGEVTINLNSLYDPDRSGVGHQPLGYDQLSALYNRYRVISCGWRISCPKTDQIIQLSTLPANNVVTPSTFDKIKEQPRARYVTQMPGGNVSTISGKAYLPSLMGRTKAQYMADDDYQSLVTTSPSELGILNVMAASVLDAPLTGAAIHVILEYTAEFYDVIPLNQS